MKYERITHDATGKPAFENSLYLKIGSLWLLLRGPRMVVKEKDRRAAKWGIRKTIRMAVNPGIAIIDYPLSPHDSWVIRG